MEYFQGLERQVKMIFLNYNDDFIYSLKNTETGEKFNKRRLRYTSSLIKKNIQVRSHYLRAKWL